MGPLDAGRIEPLCGRVTAAAAHGAGAMSQADEVAATPAEAPRRSRGIEVPACRPSAGVAAKVATWSP